MAIATVLQLLHNGAQRFSYLHLHPELTRQSELLLFQAQVQRAPAAAVAAAAMPLH
jgi:hypothetical protein